MDSLFERALLELKRGGFIAYPTETCYGLGALAADRAAVDRLRAFKGKEGQAPMSLLVADLSWAIDIAETLSAAERKLIAAFWPGPLTLLVRPKPATPYAHLAAPLVGLRCSSHPTAQALARALGEPITSTSANFHASGLLRSEEEVRRVFEPHGVLVLPDERDAREPTESSVVALGTDGLKILREGVIKRLELQRALDRP